MSVKKDPNVYKDNTYEFEFAVTTTKDDDGSTIPATGRVDLTVSLDSDEVGTLIHTDLRVNATERTAKAGTYFGRVPGTLITTRMFTAPIDFNNTPVWVRGHDASGDVNVVEKIKAFRVRKVSSS